MRRDTRARLDDKPVAWLFQTPGSAALPAEPVLFQEQTSVGYLEKLYGGVDWAETAWTEVREDVNLVFRQLVRRASKAALGELRERHNKATLQADILSLDQHEIQELVTRHVIAQAQMIAAANGS
jgi:hypothetical protein